MEKSEPDHKEAASNGRRHNTLATTSIVEYKRHKSFYFEMVHLLVEGTLFKIPRRNLEQSDIYEGMFRLTEDDSRPNPEGHSDENPIVIGGIKSEEFAAFLTILCPLSLDDDFCHFTAADWLSVLRMAHMWKLDYIRQRAITWLGDYNMNCVDKLVLAQKYDIKEWYRDAYFKLVTRPNPLTDEEGERLGLKVALKISRLREERFSKGTVYPHITKPHEVGYHRYKNEPVWDSELKEMIKFSLGL